MAALGKHNGALFATPSTRNHGVPGLWGPAGCGRAWPCLCQARLPKWTAGTHQCFSAISARVPLESLSVWGAAVFGIDPSPFHPFFLASLILLAERLGSGYWHVWWQCCMLDFGAGGEGSRRGQAAPPQPLTLGFLPPLPPHRQRIQFPAFVQAQDTAAPPPWLRFRIWKPKSLLQLGRALCVSCACPWLVGKIRTGGDSDRPLSGELARVHVLWCCWLSVSKLHKQVSGIRSIALGPRFLFPCRLPQQKPLFA